MCKKLNTINAFLQEMNFNFDVPENVEKGTLEIEDSISDLTIKENIVEFKVRRLLILNQTKVELLSCVFDSQILFEEEITKDELKEFFKQNINIVNLSIFSKISLLISNITANSLLGTIVTPPTCNVDIDNI